MPQPTPSNVAVTSFKNLGELFSDKPQLKKQIEESISNGELASVNVSAEPVLDMQPTDRPSLPKVKR